VSAATPSPRQECHNQSNYYLTRRDGIVFAAKTRASVEFLVANKHLIRVHQLDRHVIKRMAGGIADVRNQTNNMRYNADIGRVNEGACACKKPPVDYSPAIFSLLHQIIHADYEARERQIYNIDFFSSRSARLIVNGRWLPVVCGCLDRDSSSDFYI